MKDRRGTSPAHPTPASDTMSQTRDYASYPSDDGKEDIRHIEEVPHSEKDSGSSPLNNYGSVPRTTYTGRWGRLR